METEERTNADPLAGATSRPSKGPKLIILAVAIVAILSAFLVLYKLGYIPNTTSTGLAVNHSAVFSSVSSPQQLNAASATAINSSNAFNISYKVQENSYSAGIGNSTQSVVLDVAKYNRMFRVFSNTSNTTTPAIPTVSIYNGTSFINCQDGFSWICTSAPMNFAPSSYILNSVGYISGAFMNSAINNGTYPGGLFANYSSSTLSTSIGNISVNYVGPGNYDGEACSEIRTTFNLQFTFTSLNVNGKGSSELCYSDSIGLPLSGFINISQYASGIDVNISITITSTMNKVPSSGSSIVSIPT